MPAPPQRRAWHGAERLTVGHEREDVSFDQLVWTLNGTPIPYGAFLTALVTFLIVAWILFLVVKAYERMKAQPDAVTKACPFCLLRCRNRPADQAT